MAKPNHTWIFGNGYVCCTNNYVGAFPDTATLLNC